MTESLSSFQYGAVSFPHLFTFRPNEGAAKNVGKNNLKSPFLIDILEGGQHSFKLK